jgi:hypothetical protein
MKSLFPFIFILLSFLVFDGCVVPFSPPEVSSADRFLVVDGFLNTNGVDSSSIILTYTQVVSNKNTFGTELKAKVTVEGNKGSLYSFTEIGKGLYRLPAQKFNPSELFRIRIKTTANKEYLSSYVEVKQTPPIESITYKIAPDNSYLQIFINTRDPLNKTRYYRWRFEETWEYHAPLISLYEIKNKAIVDRTSMINICWQTARPSNILLASTAKLSQDIVNDFPVTTVYAASNKLLIKYSILVKQIGLTEDGFAYWNSMSKTTEKTGSLFDPQPSQVTGNIKSVSNPQELVFGYFSAVTPQQKRFFVPATLGFPISCPPTDTVSIADALKSPDILISEYLAEGARVPDYIIGTSECADCRVKGGTTVRPSFWK